MQLLHNELNLERNLLDETAKNYKTGHQQRDRIFGQVFAGNWQS